MNRVLKVALLCGIAVSVASCGTVRNILPFGLGGADEPQARATEGQRVSVLEFEQQLAPSAALSGRDFFLPGPQPTTAWTQPGGNPENAVEHVAAAPDFAVAWRRDIGAGSSDTRQVMAPVVADNGRVFVLDGEATVTAVDSSSGSVAWKVSVKPDEKEFQRGLLDFNLFGGSSTGGGFGGGAYQPGSGVSSPVLLSQVKPQYTTEAMRAKIQGKVWLEVVVMTDGRPGDIRIARSLDRTFGLDEEAIKAMRQWRFRPGVRLGSPVPVKVIVEMEFSLR